MRSRTPRLFGACSCLILSLLAGSAAADQAATVANQAQSAQGAAKALFAQATVTLDNNEGDPAKISRGMALLKQSAEQGYAPAQFKLGYHYHTGPLSLEGVEQEPEKAYYWYEKAATQNHLEAQFELAMLYNPETGFERFVSNEKYALWMRKAAELGYRKAQTHLGEMYEKGTVVALDRTLARQWYEKAAAQSDKLAISRLKKLAP